MTAERRLDTQAVGDDAEAEVVRLLQERGWEVVNLNAARRNYPLYDLRASKGEASILISVKHARAKRQVRLGALHMFEQIEDGAFIVIVLPKKGGAETNIRGGDYDLWVVPGSACRGPVDAHLHYYGHDRTHASSHPVMIKDKNDTPGGRSRSGAAFRDWEGKYRNAWQLLPA